VVHEPGTLKSNTGGDEAALGGSNDGDAGDLEVVLYLLVVNKHSDVRIEYSLQEAGQGR
jgi:hypothetical protein